jgi:hypothetical protein
LVFKKTANVSDENVGNVLVGLLKGYEENKKPVPYNKWLKLSEHLPPYTNQLIVIARPDQNTAEIYVSYVFLQHYLLDKYYKRSDINNFKFFMLLSEVDS